MSRPKEFEPSGPWGTPEVEALFTENGETLRRGGFVAAYLKHLSTSRIRRLVNPGIEGQPMVLRDDMRSGAMCEGLLLGTVDTSTGIIAPYTDLMVAYGNDELEWELHRDFTELDVNILTTVLESTQRLQLMATDTFGTQAWL